jgi:hypothetical protein
VPAAEVGPNAGWEGRGGERSGVGRWLGGRFDSDGERKMFSMDWEREDVMDGVGVDWGEGGKRGEIDTQSATRTHTDKRRHEDAQTHRQIHRQRRALGALAQNRYDAYRRRRAPPAQQAWLTMA